jgi:hypothetical protein
MEREEGKKMKKVMGLKSNKFSELCEKLRGMYNEQH